MPQNFVTDNLPLPFPKSDKKPLSGLDDPSKNITAAEWNKICQYLDDVRTFLLGSQSNNRLIGFIGNSNWNSAGATTDGASRQDDILSANPSCLLDKIYGTSAGEPVPTFDMGRGPLRAANVSSFPGFGPEVSFGKEIFSLLNGFGAAPTQSNTPWLVCCSISGVRLLDCLPAASYGTSTPTFGGLNFYNFAKARYRAAEAASGRTLSLLVSDLGPNDGANATDAALVASRWVTFWTQFLIDFPGAQLVLLQMNVNCDSSFRPTVVRPQMLLASQEIVGCRLVVADDQGLNSDNIHYGARRIYTIGQRLAAAARDQLGLLPRTTTIPAFLGYGQPEFHPVSGSSTTLKPAAYAMTGDKHLQLLLCASNKWPSGTYVAIPSPTIPASGWTQLGNATQAFGTATQGFALFSRPVAQADLDTNDHNAPGATILLSNDESYCKLFTLFGAGALALDGSVVTSKETSFSNSDFAMAGPTTTKNNSLVVIAFVTQGGGLSLGEHFAVVNANLANLTIITDEPYALNTGNFGVLVVAVGTKVTAGAVGNTTIKKSASFNAAPCGFVAAFGDA
jgi:hypothetical protein